MIGANGTVNSEKRITTIEDGTMFIHFLSVETSGQAQVQGGDLLYYVINELVCKLSSFWFAIFLFPGTAFLHRLTFTMALFRIFLMQLPLQGTLV